MYKKPVEMIAREIHYEPLPDEMRAVIIASWKRGGLPRSSAIDALSLASELVGSFAQVGIGRL